MSRVIQLTAKQGARLMPKRSKFNVRIDAAGVAARTYGGVRYDSLAEARYAAELDLKCRTRQILCWERQVPIRLEVNGHLICKMVADFKVIGLDRVTTFYEVKGFETATFKLKRKLLKACHADMNYVVVKAK